MTTGHGDEPLRIGILGASRITPLSLAAGLPTRAEARTHVSH